MLLAGDIGGTNTRLAAYAWDDGRGAPARATPLAEQTYPSRDYPSLDAIVARFVGEHGLAVTRAGFGVAGPVVRGRAVVTNLPWVVDAADLARGLDIPRVALLNDLEAIAWGVTALPAGELLTLNAGSPEAVGNAAVIAAGTGLGEAGLYWDGALHRPFACEGGHVDFAPRNALETELLLYLRERHEHVSYERVLSGPGLHNLYQFFRDTERGVELARVADAIGAGDPAAAIARAAAEEGCSLSRQALDLFMTLYGAAAGNLALQLMATGGVYVAGGIAPKLRAHLEASEFMTAFADKGRLRPLLEAIPVRVVLNDKVGLLGAARAAAQQADVGASALVAR